MKLGKNALSETTIFSNKGKGHLLLEQTNNSVLNPERQTLLKCEEQVSNMECLHGILRGSHSSKKNDDFCFERRDWMEVCQKELPTGSKLIMGLNPPFGVKAALANKFIDKALEFEPKLLILIVPKETKRLDKKEAAYNLIWEDGEKFSGKSFYLPGSVDANDNQMEQWNVKPPHLYLWSRADWTAEHKVIGLKRGHLSKDEVKVSVEENHDETEFDHPMDISPDYKGPVDTSKFIKEDGGHSGRINSSPQEQNKAKPGDSNSKVPQNQDKSPLPEHCTAANRNDHSVKKRSLKKRKGKNKGIPSRGVADRPETKPCSRKNHHNLSQPMGTTGKWSAGTSVGHDEYGIRGLDIQTNNRSEDLYRRSYFHHQDNGLSPMVFLPSTPYGVPVSSADVNYGRLNTLNRPRYAPDFDELNHRRIFVNSGYGQK